MSSEIHYILTSSIIAYILGRFARYNNTELIKIPYRLAKVIYPLTNDNRGRLISVVWCLSTIIYLAVFYIFIFIIKVSNMLTVDDSIFIATINEFWIMCQALTMTVAGILELALIATRGREKLRDTIAIIFAMLLFIVFLCMCIMLVASGIHAITSMI